MAKSQLWTKNFLINSMVNFFIYLVYYLLMVIIAVYTMDKFQASPSQAGLAASIFILGTLAARIFGGRWVERIGQKKMLYMGLTVYLVTTLLYFKAISLPFLLFIRFFHGVGFGIASIATGTIVAKIIPPQRRGEGISYYAMSTTLASAIGPFLGIYLHQHASFTTILVLCILLLAISFVTTFFLKISEAKLTDKELNNIKQLKLENFIEFSTLPIAVIGAIVGFSYSSIIIFLSSYTKEIHLIEAGSFFFIVYSVAILISRPVTGRWFDSKGENFVMYPSFLLFALGLFILSQAQQGFILLTASIFIGFGFGTFLSSGQAIAIKLSPCHRMGLATSTFFAITDVGVGVGPILLGLLVPSIGFRGLYVSMAIIVLVAMGLYFFLHGRNSQLLTESSSNRKAAS